MTDYFTAPLIGAALGAVFGFSAALSFNRSTLWPLIPLLLAGIGLWRLTVHAPQATTELSRIDSFGFLLQGIVLAAAVFAGLAGGWGLATRLR